MTADRADAELRGYAEDFADELTNTLRGVLPDAPEFRSFLTGHRFWVVPANENRKQEMILMRINGQPRLALDVVFYCHWDTARSFLAVEQSHVKLHYNGPSLGIPLLRYEYERDWTSYPPGAHLHVHAHRDEIAYLLRLADGGPPKRRLKKDKIPQLSEMHLTVGGHRFRPCFEDILGMVIREFDVETVGGWEGVISQGVERWRKKQLFAAVRDLPQDAADTLRKLGWTVEPPDGFIPGQRPTTVPRLFYP